MASAPMSPRCNRGGERSSGPPNFAGCRAVCNDDVRDTVYDVVRVSCWPIRNEHIPVSLMWATYVADNPTASMRGTDVPKTTGGQKGAHSKSCDSARNCVALWRLPTTGGPLLGSGSYLRDSTSEGGAQGKNYTVVRSSVAFFIGLRTGGSAHSKSCYSARNCATRLKGNAHGKSSTARDRAIF